MGKLKDLLTNYIKECYVCGSPMPPEYAVCFVCLSDNQRRKIRKLEAELADIKDCLCQKEDLEDDCLNCRLQKALNNLYKEG